MEEVAAECIAYGLSVSEDSSNVQCKKIVLNRAKVKDELIAGMITWRKIKFLICSHSRYRKKRRKFYSKNSTQFHYKIYYYNAKHN